MAVHPEAPRQLRDRSASPAMSILPIVQQPALPEQRRYELVHPATGAIWTAMGTGSAANDAIGRA